MTQHILLVHYFSSSCKDSRVCVLTFVSAHSSVWNENFRTAHTVPLRGTNFKRKTFLQQSADHCSKVLADNSRKSHLLAGLRALPMSVAQVPQ